MSSFGRYLFNSFFGARASNATPPMDSSVASLIYTYQPSIEDVLSVKDTLLEHMCLPLELIDSIVDFAEYWPHTTSVQSGPEITVRAGGENENRFIIRSSPLGLVPELERSSDYAVTDQYAERLHNLVPQPWAEGRKFPHGATQEVLNGWCRTSHPRGEFPCRKIVFTIRSHDQGWGGNAGSANRYHGSYTWFEVGKEKLSAFREGAIPESWDLAPSPHFSLDSPEEVKGRTKSRLVCSLRTVSPTVYHASANDDNDSSDIGLKFKHDLLPSVDCLQKNVVADKNSKRHAITWSYNDNIQPDSEEARKLEKQGRGATSGTGEYVRNLKLGDTVTVWAKARFPGWVNVVDDIKIDLYWAV